MGNIYKYIYFNDALFNHLHLDCLQPYLILDLFSQHSFGNMDSIIF